MIKNLNLQNRQRFNERHVRRLLMNNKIPDIKLLSYELREYLNCVSYTLKHTSCLHTGLRKQLLNELAEREQKLLEVLNEIESYNTI